MLSAHSGYADLMPVFLSEKWKVKSEKWKVKSEKWDVSGKWWVVNGVGFYTTFCLPRRARVSSSDIENPENSWNPENPDSDKERSMQKR